MALVKGLFLSSAAFLCVAFPAWADETRIMTYDVYAGGIHALDATLTLRQGAKDYHIALKSATHGLLGTMAPWSGEFRTDGVFGPKGDLYPKQHVSRSVWRGDAEEKSYTYDGKGRFVGYKVTDDGKDKTPQDLDITLTKNTTDLLSATLTMMRHLPKSQSCDGKSLIFDGDRSYQLVFKDEQKDVLNKSDYNVYQGPAVSCTVEVQPEKGKWKKKPRGWLSIQEQGRQKGGLPAMWFGQPDLQGGIAPVSNVSNAPYVPVKIRVKTDYGILLMHLTSYKVAPAPISVKH